MNEWWNGLDTALKVLYCIAIPSSLILIIQTLISLCGIGGGGHDFNVSDTSGIDMSDIDIPSDAGADFDIDVDVDADADIGTDHDIDIDHDADQGDVSDLGGLRLFTVQTVIAFLTVFSWTAIVAKGGGTGTFAAMLIGTAFGAAAMYGVAKIVSLSGKLAENGTVQLKNALGEHGTVYLTIPPSGSGEGKITVTVQGRFMELAAVQDGSDPIKTGTSVRVTDLVGDTLVVEKDGEIR